MILNKSSSFILIHITHKPNYTSNGCIALECFIKLLSPIVSGVGARPYYLLASITAALMAISRDDDPQWPGPWGNIMPDVEQLSVLDLTRYARSIQYTAVLARTIKCTIMNITWDTSRFGENIPSPFVFLVGLPLLFSGIDNKSVEDLLGSEYPNRRHISGN